MASKAEKNLDSEKSCVLQEAKLFHQSPVNPKKCTEILANILHMINKGELLGTKEATECFFAITKLFQSHDPVLRRMVYLGIKALSQTAEDVIIVTSSLTKDMSGQEESHRAAAIRALSSVTVDHFMLQSYERYMKQAIVDKNPNIASAALISSLNQAQKSLGSLDVVKRWSNQAIEVLTNENSMVQYHALGFLFAVRQSDKLAVSKMVSKLIKSALHSPFAVCFLIRIMANLIVEEAIDHPKYLTFIETCLRNSSEMVVFEAANAIVNLRSKEINLNSAISTLQHFCSSQVTANRFAAVRTLNQVSIHYPDLVSTCNADLETLISDSNRSIATLAITTLLKTGAETSVERLMKQIATFVSEISDEFKIVVVKAIEALCVKFPRKHSILMNFLSTMLREEGGMTYKSCITETFIHLIQEFPDAKEKGLSHLCEFIEDCEHTSLAVKVLHLLGSEGPNTSRPGKYIRYIYNRVILENTEVRAAAVSTLAKFGAVCDHLRPNILVLLQRCQLDTDDEVRDRATYYKGVLETKDGGIINEFVFNDIHHLSLIDLTLSLKLYGFSDCTAPFNLDSVTKEKTILRSNATAPSTQKKKKESRKFVSPEMEKFGKLFKASDVLELTESETEITVQCSKYVFLEHVVFQFDCINTLPDQIVEDLDVFIESPENFQLVKTIPCPRLEYDTPASIYAVFALPTDPFDWTGPFSPTLTFTIKDCDPISGEPDTLTGYTEEFGLEDVNLLVSDFMTRSLRGSFSAAWEDLKEESNETLALNDICSLDEAINLVIQHLAMHPCERSDVVPDENATSHTLLLAGKFLGDVDVMAKVKFALTDHIALNLCIRSNNEEVKKLVIKSVL